MLELYNILAALDAGIMFTADVTVRYERDRGLMFVISHYTENNRYRISKVVTREELYNMVNPSLIINRMIAEINEELSKVRTL